MTKLIDKSQEQTETALGREEKPISKNEVLYLKNQYSKNHTLVQQALIDRNALEFDAGLHIGDSQKLSIKGSSVSGFNVYQKNYKMLEMAYCTLLQRDNSGKQRGLCWAASTGTLIRYKTGNRKITATKIADELGIGYDQGGYVTDCFKAMKKHSAAVYYEPLGRFASSSTEIRHNINNRFPVIMDCEYIKNGKKMSGHMVTLIGYKDTGKQFVLIYWDSARELMCSTTFHRLGGTTIELNNCKYSWKQSVLVPLGI